MAFISIPIILFAIVAFYFYECAPKKIISKNDLIACEETSGWKVSKPMPFDSAASLESKAAKAKFDECIDNWNKRVGNK